MQTLISMDFIEFDEDFTRTVILIKMMLLMAF